MITFYNRSTVLRLEVNRAMGLLCLSSTTVTRHEAADTCSGHAVTEYVLKLGNVAYSNRTNLMGGNLIVYESTRPR